MAVLTAFSGTAAAQVTPHKEGIKPGTIVKPTNSITGKVDHSKPYLKADSQGVLRPHNAYGRRLPGAGLKEVGNRIYQTNPITGRVDYSKRQLKIIPPSQ
ncbi:MAG: hypothetical protein ACJAVI_003153 [Candidatus Azotimanducaceae bacterium]|jgi:hypothetical protein